MKRTFKIKLDDEELTVSVERQGDQLVVEQDGRSYWVTPVVDDTRRTGGAQSSGGSSTNAFGGATARPVRQTPTARPVDSHGSPVNPKTAPSSPASQPAGQSALHGGVPAPVTGTIKEILANVGDSVSEGERVMMMEAMKMDIEIVAPASGTVKQVFVKPGDGVKEHQPLFSIE